MAPFGRLFLLIYSLPGPPDSFHSSSRPVDHIELFMRLYCLYLLN